MHGGRNGSMGFLMLNYLGFHVVAYRTVCCCRVESLEHACVHGGRIGSMGLLMLNYLGFSCGGIHNCMHIRISFCGLL